MNWSGERRVVGNLLRGVVFAFAFLGVAGPRADLLARAQAIPAHKIASLPVGLTLPVQIGHKLQAGRVPVGTTVVAKTTQRIPLSEHTYLDKGAVLRGEVLASAVGDGAARPATLTLRFTSLQAGKEAVPLRVRAVAIANFTNVSDAAAPTLGSVSRGNSGPANWTTMQVGGDLVFRELWVGGVYDSGMRLVGRADYHGVYSLPKPLDSGGPALPRALGVFSAGAAGLYGFGDACRLQSNGGTIILTCLGKRAVLRDGDDLLLEVIPAT